MAKYRLVISTPEFLADYEFENKIKEILKNTGLEIIKIEQAINLARISDEKDDEAWIRDQMKL